MSAYAHHRCSINFKTWSYVYNDHLNALDPRGHASVTKIAPWSKGFSERDSAGSNSNGKNGEFYKNPIPRSVDGSANKKRNGLPLTARNIQALNYFHTLEEGPVIDDGSE